jgi:hypothetical protein
VARTSPMSVPTDVRSWAANVTAGKSNMTLARMAPVIAPAI